MNGRGFRREGGPPARFGGNVSARFIDNTTKDSQT